MRTMFWESYLAFKKKQHWAHQSWGPFELPAEVGNIAWRRSTQEGCHQALCFYCYFWMSGVFRFSTFCFSHDFFVGQWRLHVAWAASGLCFAVAGLCCISPCQNESRWTASALYCLDALGPVSKSTGNTDSSLKCPQGQVQSPEVLLRRGCKIMLA